MGEKVFKPSRTKIDSKVVCTKQNRDNDFAHIDSAKGNTCMAIDYGKVYQFFPGEYQLQEVSTLPRSYHSQYELNLIDQGKKKLRQRVTREMFTIEPKQRAKAFGKAPTSLNR
jgi:hypothetical protein